MENVVILMTNKAFLEKAIYTIHQLRSNGHYNGDVELLIGDDLINENLDYLINNLGVNIKYFPDINRSEEIKLYRNKPISADGREINKSFQFHKLYCFDTYFKKYQKCLYLDSGMNIFKDINGFFDLDCKYSLIAHSDAYPKFEWKLSIQFDKIYFKELYEELNMIYDLNIDYFQSGILLYDTNIIQTDTFNKLLSLSKKWINSRTNEQAIMNLLFNCELNIWKPLDTQLYYYDSGYRINTNPSDYIMLKNIQLYR